MKPELIESAKAELEERLQGRSYRCSILDDVKPPLEAAKAAAERLGKKG